MSNMNPYDKLQITLNADGTLTRSLPIPASPPSADLNHPVLSKDIPLDQSKNTWIRLYLPRAALDYHDHSSPPEKLPLVVYFHGGGFILFSAASTVCHIFCAVLSAETNSIVASVEYRLAPEHRLPAAYEDAADAMRLIGSSSDEWLRNHADLSRCFLMGGSAGGNIAYHAGLLTAPGVRIRGMILQQPFFGGAQRTESELRLENGDVFPVCVSDLMWQLALPVGVDRDHEFCNPRDSVSVVPIGLKVLVTGCDGDPLFDRQVEVAKMLEEKGVEVVAHFGLGGYHGQDFFEPDKVKQLYSLIKNLISS